MTDFASTALSGNMLDVAQLITEHQSKLPVRVFTDSVSVGFSGATPASYTTVTGLSRSVDVEADDRIILLSVLNVSCGTAGDKIAAQHYNDAAAAGLIYYFTEPTGQTTGDSGPLVVATLYTNRTGTIAFSTKWIRAAGAGNIYCKENSTQFTIILKGRP